MKSALSIAGSDSGGGAGIQQDIKVFSALGLHPATAITAVTAQNTLGVQDYVALPPKIIEEQIDSVLSDLKPSAVKTGMLATAEIISLVGRKMKEYSVENLVVDPVMVSTSGHPLLSEDAVTEMKKLAKQALIVTPNVYEAEMLSGVKIKERGDMEAAAEKIGDCVVKGGHIDGTDVLFYEGKKYAYETKRYRDIRIHGTGCAYSAALASYVALGLDVPSAVSSAKAFLDEAISRAYKPGTGLYTLEFSGAKLAATYEDEEKNRICAELESALQNLLSNPAAPLLSPEVGMNLAYALPKAKTIEDIAGVTGRIVRERTRLKAVGKIDFAGTSHVGRIVLTAMASDPSMRSAMNVRYSEEVVSACRALGLETASFDREKQPKDTKTMEWGTAEAIRQAGRVPDAIYDTGAKGKEAMVRIIGKNPAAVVSAALRIAERLK